MNAYPSNRPSRKPSKLVEALRGLADGHGSASVGFRRVEAAPKRKTAVVAGVRATDSSSITEAIHAGVDAIEISIAAPKEIALLADIVSRFHGPVGVAVKSADASEADSLAETGVDWVRLPLGASAWTMAWPRPSRVLSIPFGLDLQLAVGVSGLNVDAILIGDVKGDRSEFSYLDALRLRALGALTRKPILLNVVTWLPPSAAENAEYLGADALFVELDGSQSPSLLTDYLQAVERHDASPR
jgi:hypothetical protein